MTQHPYTDTDLRTHAARLHAGAANDADERIRPSVQRRWGSELDADQIDEVCDEVTDLLDRTANLSRWAVNLGADSLQPDAHQLTWSAGEQPIVRVHFAFHAGMSDEARDYLVTAVGEALQAQMDSATEAAR